MKIKTPIGMKTLACALIGAASILTAGTSHAAFIALPPGTPEIPGVGNPLTTITPSGSYVAHLENTFADPNFPMAGQGLLRSVVVRRGDGLLDFYYQVVNLSTDPIDEIFRLEIGGYNPSFVVEAAYATSLGSITGLPAFSGSITPSNPGDTVWSADRQVNLPQLPAPASFDFDAAHGFGSANPLLNNNILAGEISNWLVLHTDQPDYTETNALINGASVGMATALAPIPEPSTALFGLAIFGVCAGGRFRKSSPRRKD